MDRDALILELARAYAQAAVDALWAEYQAALTETREPQDDDNSKDQSPLPC